MIFDMGFDVKTKLHNKTIKEQITNIKGVIVSINGILCDTDMDCQEKEITVLKLLELLSKYVNDTDNTIDDFTDVLIKKMKKEDVSSRKFLTPNRNS